MNQLTSEFLSRIRDNIERSTALGRLSSWLEKNTTISDAKYSLEGHEFQREIIDSVHPSQAVIKPSQVGMSEGTARLVMGFIAVTRSTTAMYLLPTVGESQRFCKSRIDTIIEGSSYMKNSLVSGSDSSSYKKIGSSQLFMGGTYGKAIISIPVSLLVVDELDFCNPANVKTAESRLSHSSVYNEELDIRGIRRKLSTPTVPGVGISAEFARSNQMYRLCKCKSCNNWVWPSFLDDVVIPGWDLPMRDTTASDIEVLESRGLIESAKLLCSHCHAVISRNNLGPEYREWVAEHPEIRTIEGFHVNPFDLPNYHTPQSLLRKMVEYGEETGHFRNFTLGLPYADSSNSVLPDALRSNTSVNPVYPDSARTTGCIAGLDVGKVSWLTIGKTFRIDGIETLHVIWMEQIKISTNDEESLVATVAQRLKQFNVIKCCVDALPYTSDMLRLQGMFLPGQVLPVQYTLNDKKLPEFIVNEKDNSISSNRTKSFNSLVKRINTGRVKFPIMAESKVMELHLQGMRRVDRIDDQGEVESSWEKTGPDHYFHSLNYLYIASQMVVSGVYTEFAPPITIKEAFIGRTAVPKER